MLTETVGSKEVLNQALNLLEKSVAHGVFVASPQKVGNYHRLWARDGMICGLAALALKREDLVQAFGLSLKTLLDGRGPQGQIPSNVELVSEGSIGSVSLGTLAGRVDANTWFVIGAFHYLEAFPNSPLREDLYQACARIFSLLNAWEYNSRGLIYTPEGGTWADDYILGGYTFYDQVLRLWAEKLALQNQGFLSSPSGGDALHWIWPTEKRAEFLRLNFWPVPETKGQAYHPLAQEKYLQDQRKKSGSLERAQHFLQALKPSGYQPGFDTFAHSLALALGLATEDQKSSVFQVAQSTGHSLMMPAFWPTIAMDSPQGQELEQMASLAFKNRPDEYHNGGIWPMINGWWGIGLWEGGQKTWAQSLLTEMDQALMRSQSPSFPEYFQAQSFEAMGTGECTWGAAAYILLTQHMKGLSGLKL